MFKLLPTQEKKKLEKEYRIRLCIVAFSFIFFIELIGAISLLPAFFLSTVKEKEVITEQLIVSKVTEDEKDEKFDEEIKKVREQIQQLKIDEKEIAIAHVLNTVNKNKPTGVRLTSFNLVRNVGEESELRIIGIAQNRDSLVSFRDTLENESLFSGVELPISDLAKSKDISFSLNLTGKF